MLDHSTRTVVADHARPDFGLDAPGPLLGSAVGGVLFLGGGLAFRIAGWPGASVVGLAVWPGIAMTAWALFHLWGSRVGKLRKAEWLLDRRPWSGHETVLDVGCGRGLLLIAAARRLTTGRAIGIDVWSQKDQWRNTADATRGNAMLAGVDERVEVHDGDARALDFSDETFDVVVSSLVIHNIPDSSERRRALDEMVRVLKPGGDLLIIDLMATSGYAAHLEDTGLVDVRRSRPLPLFLPTTRAVTARKPGP